MGSLSPDFLSVCPREDQSGPVNVIYKSRKEASEENNPVSILISDFQPPENREELNFCCLRHPVLVSGNPSK